MRCTKSARSLTGSCALVTGAASGIGRALARELAARGARLALVDVDAVGLGVVAEATGGLAFVADVRDEAAMERVALEVAEELGVLDLLFVNAGVATVGSLTGTPIEDARWVMDVNYLGSLIATRRFVPAMVEAGRGHVVFTASIAGLIGAPGMGAYSASKFAVVGFAESLRVELVGSGVSVTTVCPGYVPTGLHAATRYHHDGFRRFLDAPPERMGLTAEEVARRSVDAALARRPVLRLGIERFAASFGRSFPAAYAFAASRLGHALGLLGGGG